MSSADAKKYLTGVEQHIRNKLFETVRASSWGAPRACDYYTDDVKTIVDSDLEAESYGDFDIASLFEVITMTKEYLEHMTQLSNDGYSIQVRVECGILSVCATKKIFDEKSYNTAAEYYNDLLAKSKIAEAELQHWSSVIEQRKKETLEPDLPNTVEELQALVRKLQSTKQ